MKGTGFGSCVLAPGTAAVMMKTDQLFFSRLLSSALRFCSLIVSGNLSIELSDHHVPPRLRMQYQCEERLRTKPCCVAGVFIEKRCSSLRAISSWRP